MNHKRGPEEEEGTYYTDVCHVMGIPLFQSPLLCDQVIKQMFSPIKCLCCINRYSLPDFSWLYIQLFRSSILLYEELFQKYHFSLSLPIKALTYSVISKAGQTTEILGQSKEHGLTNYMYPSARSPEMFKTFKM